MKNLTLTAGDIGDAGSFAGLEDPLKEGTATHSTILSWRIPWPEEPDSYDPLGHSELDTSNLAHMYTDT